MTNDNSFIDTEILIGEVEQRPNLWDSSNEEYKNRDLRQNSWNDIGTIVINQFNNLLEKEKKTVVEKLQKRWKTARDAFIRCRAKGKSLKSGAAAKKQSKYIYYDNLKFLEKTLDLNSIQTNLENQIDEKPNEVEDGELDTELDQVIVPHLSNMSWNKKKTLSFIAEYEKRPILWRKDEKHYHDPLKKEDAWRELGEIFGEEIETLKKKMDGLRGSCRREKNRMRTGNARNEIYTPKWFAWKSMKFLEDPDELPSTINNIGSTPEKEENHTSDNSGLSNDVDEERNENLAIGSQVTDRGGTVKSPENATSSKKLFRSPPKKLPKRRGENSRVKEAYRILKNKATTEKKDESAIFGDFIAEKMRKLGSRERAILQHDIYNLVFQAEMNHSFIMTSQSPQQTSPRLPHASSPPQTSSYSSYSYCSGPIFPATECYSSPVQQSLKIEEFQKSDVSVDGSES